MAKPGMIIMAIICMAVSMASCGGRSELFTPEPAEARGEV
jgi:hypothetical protein